MDRIIDSRKATFKKYFLNPNSFKDINIDNAYWAGFIAADGHITPGGQIMIKLNIKDKSHLSKFRDFLEYTGPIKEFIVKTNFKNNASYCSLVVQSIQLSSDLNVNFAIPIGAKSKSLKLPKINDRFLLSFIAGYFDGDGCLYFDKNQYPTITLIGNCVFLNDVKQFLENYFNIRTSLPYVNNKKSPTSYMYRTFGKKAELILNSFSISNYQLQRKRII